MGHAEHTEASRLSNEGQVRPSLCHPPPEHPQIEAGGSWSVLRSLRVFRLVLLGAVHPVGCLPSGLGLLTILTIGGLYGIVVLPRVGKLGLSLLAQASEMPG